jgi:putative membrane-bound dehydrogenase-like protein
MTLPAGFRATLFAGEPDVVQPIAFTFDDRGRMWVVECFSYPKWLRGDAKGNDRVSIFEDTDGDGKFDKKTVFLDNGVNISGIELGFGGVWLCATPNLIFVPDRDGDDKPDGPPQVVLDGWDIEARHNVFCSLHWGPDGWLYGCNGILSNSKVGKPGTPADKRVAINCGVWRYHPTRQVFEAFAHGTTNPWGLDFDEYGQCFITNCVISHLFHVVQGGHYERMFGQDLNPHVYGLMKSCADHIHWGGGHWTSSRGGTGVHDDPGGGHAHSGAMVYLGDQWPAEYRNRVFMCNIHGNRINQDILERKGSTYVAKHGPDFLKANDDWFRGIAIHQGPDGSAYVSDWCDTGECHNYEVADKTNGRIYKITYGKPKPFTGDLSRLSDVELAKLQASPNEWLVRHARRLLQERAAAGRIDPQAAAVLHELLKNGPSERERLRALWALYVAGQWSDALNVDLLVDNRDDLRAWGIRFAVDAGPSPDVLAKLSSLAIDEAGPLSLMQLASALQRLEFKDRDVGRLSVMLASHSNAGIDADLAQLVWYGVHDLVLQDPKKAVLFALVAESSLIRRNTTRHVVSQGRTATVGLIFANLDKFERSHRDVLEGMQQAWAGRRKVDMPSAWPTAYAQLRKSTSSDVRHRAMALAVLFDDKDAIAEMKRLLPDAKTDLATRQSAFRAFEQRQSPEFISLVLPLLDDVGMRPLAIRALAGYSDLSIPGKLVSLYQKLPAAEKIDVLQTLSSRPAFALALLDAVEKNTIPRNDITPVLARQLLALKNKDVAARLERVWGTLRPATAEKKAQIEKYKRLLTPNSIAKADVKQGRALYTQHCASCHKLFGEGGTLGPDLTGGQRKSLDYILENVVDPNAIVAREYLVTVVETKTGRVLSGIIKDDNPRALTLQTTNETVVIPKNEIEDQQTTKQSMMPEGMFDKLSAAEIRALIAYLAADGEK